MDEARSISTNDSAVPARPKEQPERLRVLAYVVADKASTYRVIMDVFAKAKRQYVLRLRPEEVLERAKRRGHAPDLDEGPEHALDQLVSWGNLGRTQVTARARSLAEFARRRSLYQLTPEGEAAQLAVELGPARQRSPRSAERKPATCCVLSLARTFQVRTLPAALPGLVSRCRASQTLSDRALDE